MKQRWHWMIAGVMAMTWSAAGCKSETTSPEELNDRATADKPVEEEAKTDTATQGVEETGEPGAAASAGGDEAAQGGAAQAKVGEPAPDFTLMDHTGKEVTLSALKGKPVVLEWTNPTCPYVVRHYTDKTMSKTHTASGGTEDVVWLAIDSSHFVTAEKAAEWREKEGFEHPVLMDASGEVGKIYKASTTPHMFVIDREGKLVYSGAIDDNDRGDKKPEEVTNYVGKALEALKEGKPVDVSETKPYGCSVKYKS